MAWEFTFEAPLGQIYYVYPNSPASYAGVQIGDQIVTIGGKQFNPLLAEPRYPADIRSGMIIYYQFSRRGAQVILPITDWQLFRKCSIIELVPGNTISLNRTLGHRSCPRFIFITE